LGKGLIYALSLVLLSSGAASSEAGAEAASSAYVVSLSIGDYQIRENVLNRIRHRGTLFSGGFFYERQRGVSRHKFEIYLAFSTLKSRYDPDKESFAVNPSLDYRYARKIADLKPGLSLFLGGIVGLDMHHVWLENWDDSHLYWLTSYYLGVDGILTYERPGGRELFLEVHVPVLSIVSRPPERFLYKVANPKFSWIIDELHSNLTLTSIHEHFALNTKLGYAFSYTDNFDQHLYWRFSYVKNTVQYSRDLTILTHSFGASFVF
jgi:hypothetical protein